MKVGRNDPCPCGSGKKYKQCCLKPQAPAQTGDLVWHRLRRGLDDLTPQFLKFSAATVGHAGIDEAWSEFHPGAGPFDAGSPHIPLFLPWYLYDWTPDSVESGIPESALNGLSLAGAYLEKKRKALDPLLVRYMESCLRSHFSFHEVVRCSPGSGFLLRDILTGEQHDVTERSGSQQAQAGDIMFARVVAVDDVCMLEGCGPAIIPPREKGPILELRKHIRESGQPLSAEVVKDYDLEMIEIYLEIAERLFDPRMRGLQNTDGDPLLFHRLIYDIDSPRQAFDALKDLCLTEDEAELLGKAGFGAAGELHKVEFSWQKPGNAKNKEWTNTILGQIVIEGRMLTAQVNSEQRGKKFQAIVAERLPGKARYKTTVIESPEAMLAHAKGNPPTAGDQQPESEALMALPEVREQVTQMLRAHYANWVQEKIPALGGKTPLQAVKTLEGREMVEALFVELERHGRNMNPSLDPSIVKELRARLGLAEQRSLPL